jgi:glutamyl-tRNA reductase
MSYDFKSISLSYKNASLAIRETVALSTEQSGKLLIMLRDYLDLQEALVVSTCNRTEVYYSSEKNLGEEIVKLISIAKSDENIKSAFNNFTLFNNSAEAVNHLYRVAIGLESQVVGDLQITGQLKNAYQASADAGMAGMFLHRLMHSIFFTNKRVVQESNFRDGAASIAYAAVELIDELTLSNRNAIVLVLGLGEIGVDVCKNLVDAGYKNIRLCNRTREKSEKLALEIGAELAEFSNVINEIGNADVVLSSINLEEPFITKEKLSALNILTHKYFIDLSVPRSVAEDVEELNSCIVYNIDKLEQKSTAALELRLKSIPKVEEIIGSSIADFNEWSNEMIVSPTINKLKNALEQIRQEEMARYLKQLDESQTQLVDQITKNLMQKIIKLPVIQLKAACKRGEAETLIDVLNDLFNLEKQPEKLA